MLSAQQHRHPLAAIEPCISLEEVLRLQQAVREVFISDEIKMYMVKVVHQTRKTEGVKVGAGPRASLALMQVCQALALMDDMEFVSPEHVQEVAIPVLSHRLSLESQAKYSGLTAGKVIANILETIEVPQ